MRPPALAVLSYSTTATPPGGSLRTLSISEQVCPRIPGHLASQCYFQGHLLRLERPAWQDSQRSSQAFRLALDAVESPLR